MVVAGAPGRGNAGVQRGPGFLSAPRAGKKLAVLEIGGDIISMPAEQRFEMLIGCGCVARVGALHRQTIERKRVIRFGGDEFFQHLAACFLLWLGHGKEARIIDGLRQFAKSPPGSGAAHEKIRKVVEG